MNIGSIGIVSGATAQLAQSRVTEVDRVQQENTVHDREVESADLAEQAEGVGVTHEESATSDRDADGRLPWHLGGSGKPPLEHGLTEDSLDNAPPQHAKDPTGQAGTQLDLDG